VSDADGGSSAGLRRPLLIGLVGPSGCGKSTIAGWIAERNGRIIDADAVSREVTAPGQPGHEAVLRRFGDEFRGPDGSLDRAALGRHVFADPDALADLERIVHPLVRPRILAAIDEARRSGADVVAIEAIKLVEAGYAAMCDEVWLITCPTTDQQRRLVERGLLPADEAQRAAAQAGLSERLARTATRILDTAGTRAEARRRVDGALSDALARWAEASRA
jgi:dephospho-CoA kinase